MKFFKTLSFILFIIIALVIGGTIFFVSTFDANHYKKQIISLVNKQTGRDLTIDGDLKLAVYPDIAIEMGNTSLSNAAGFTGDKFATIGSAKVSVELLPLLKKKIKVDKVRLNSLKLNLHKKADGSTNWDDLVQGNKQNKPKDDKPPSEVVQEMLNNFSIAGVSLKDAHIHWRDDQSGQDITLSPLHLKTGTFKPGNPLPVELALVLKQKQPATTVKLEGSTTVTLSAGKGADNQKFSLANLNMETTVTGSQIPKGALTAHISGNINGSPSLITAPDLKVLATLNGDLIPQGEAKIDLDGSLKFDVNGQLATISNMKLDTKVNGKLLQGGNLHAVVLGNTQFNLASQKLSIPNMDVNAKLAQGFIKGGAVTAHIIGNTQFDVVKQLLNISGLKLDAGANGELLKGGKANSQISGDLTVNLALSQLTMPKITINTTVDGGLIPGGNMVQQGQGAVDLNWENKQGGVDLSSLLIKLADLELKGNQVQLKPLAEKPSVKGQFQTNTFNLKNVLKMLGVEPPVTSNPKALSQVQAQFGLQADSENAELQQLKLTLDKTSITGKLTIKNFTAPSIQPELKIDSINVDDYLAPPSSSTQAAANNATNSQELFPMETLRGLDIDGGVTINSMIINKLSLNNISTRIKAKQGLINIDPANANLYKGKYKGRIVLDAKQSIPTMKMRHELTGLRSEGLLFDLFKDKYISGDTKLVTEFTSRGNTLDALLKNLNGTTSMGFNDGTIRDSSLAEKVSLAVKVFEKKEVKGDKSVVTFTGLSGDWKTTNGVFKTDNLSLLSPYFNISGTGTADVAKQVLDMKLRIGPHQKKGARPIFAPLHIYGTFSNPKFKLDIKDLIKALAQQDLDKAKQKAKEKLEQAKQEAKEKLKQKEREAKAKLDAKKKQLQQQFVAEKAAKEKQIKQKVEAAKAKALEKVEKKLGDKMGGDSKKAVEDAVEGAEEKVKNKLKDKLRGLF